MYYKKKFILNVSYILFVNFVGITIFPPIEIKN